MKSPSQIPFCYLFSALVLLALTPLIATAQETGGNILYACYQRSSGHLRAVTSTIECRSDEVPVSWNVEAPPREGRAGQQRRDRRTVGVGQLIIQMERQWANAYVKRDIATIDRILAGDFIETDADGRQLNKAQYLDLARNPTEPIASISVEGTNVRVFDNTAVSVGSYKVRNQKTNQPESFRYTAVYVRQDGRWQAVAFQSTRLQ